MAEVDGSSEGDGEGLDERGSACESCELRGLGDDEVEVGR